MRSIVNAASLYAPKRSKDFRRRDLRNRSRTQFRKDESLELAHLTRKRACAKTRRLESKPFPRNCLEGLSGCALLPNRAAIRLSV